MYGKLENGKLIHAPVNYLTTEGNLIFNFNTNVELMKANGFKEVIDTIPEHDSNTHYVTFKEYVDNGISIVVIYNIIEKAPAPPSPEDEIALLKLQIETMQEAIDFMLFTKSNNKV